MEQPIKNIIRVYNKNDLIGYAVEYENTTVDYVIYFSNLDRYYKFDKNYKDIDTFDFSDFSTYDNNGKMMSGKIWNMINSKLIKFNNKSLTINDLTIEQNWLQKYVEQVCEYDKKGNTPTLFTNKYIEEIEYDDDDDTNTIIITQCLFLGKTLYDGETLHIYLKYPFVFRKLNNISLLPKIIDNLSSKNISFILDQSSVEI